MSSRVLRRWKYHEDRCRTMRELSGELCDRQTGNRANKEEKKLVTMTQDAQRVSGKMLGDGGGVNRCSTTNSTSGHPNRWPLFTLIYYKPFISHKQD